VERLPSTGRASRRGDKGRHGIALNETPANRRTLVVGTDDTYITDEDAGLVAHAVEHRTVRFGQGQKYRPGRAGA